MSRKLLLVDDTASLLTTNGRALRRMLGPDWEITELTSPVDAVARIQTGERFDVVVSDFQMPIMSGDEVVATARQHSEKTLCILLSSALREATKASQAYSDNLQAHHVVEKEPSTGIFRVADLIREHFAPTPI